MENEAQAFIVVGGERWDGATASTEIYKMGTSAWKTVAPLPFEVSGLAGVTLDNTVYMTGPF